MRIKRLVINAVLPWFLLFLVNCAGGDEEFDEVMDNNENNISNENMEQGDENQNLNEELGQDVNLNQDLNLENNVNNVNIDQNVGIGNEDLNQGSEDSDENFSVDNVQEDVSQVTEDFDTSLSSQRVVRYVSRDANVYDSGKSNVVGSFTKGEPLVVLIEDGSWAQITPDLYIEVSNLSQEVVSRSGTHNPFK